jgi:hypothetical protein
VGGFVNNPEAVNPPVHHGTGPYSSMYRMGADSQTTSSFKNMSPASIPHQGASTFHPPSGTTPQDTSVRSSRSAKSSNKTTPASQPKASSSKTASKYRSSTKQSTTEQQSGQTSHAPGVNSQHYRRDYERGSNIQEPSKEQAKTPASSKGRSKHGTLSTSRPHSHPQDSASPSLSANTVHSSPGENHTSSSSRACM